MRSRTVSGVPAGAAGLCFLLIGAATCRAETVAAARDGVKVWVGKEVIATLRKGHQMTVVGRQGDWLGVRLRTKDGVKAGWVARGSVAPVKEPVTTPAVPSRPAPETRYARGIDELKKAAVYIKVDDGLTRSSGSGFVVGRRPDTVWIVTNEHVVHREKGITLKVQAVFESGTPGERVRDAEILAVDKERDLAVLRARLPRPPHPVDLSPNVRVTETLPILILGFPHGELLSASRGNPAITVGKGIVSSIRKSERGSLETYQIDGDINPGNSGGPVVDSRGSLIGVSVTTVMGARIANVVPVPYVQEMLHGRGIELTLKSGKSSAGEVRLTARGRLIDPLRNITGFSLLMAPKRTVPGRPKPDASGVWGAAAAGMDEQRLKSENGVVEGEIVLRGTARGRIPYLYQAKCTGRDGKVRYSEPTEYVADFGGGGGDSDWLGTTDKPKADWLGSSGTAGTKSPGAQGVLGTGESLIEAVRNAKGAMVVRLKVNAKDVIPSLKWSADGRFLYVLERQGLLRKIRVPAFTVDRKLAIGHECSWLEQSREGLLVVVKGRQELWVLDGDSFGRRKQISIAGVETIVSSPQLSVGFVPLESGRELAAVHLGTGITEKRHDARQIGQEQGLRIKKHDSARPLLGFRQIAVTPDGNYLFCDSVGSLHRLAIRGDSLEYEEAGPAILNGRPIVFSPDSRYVTAGRMDGGASLLHHQDAGTYTTYVYHVTDLQRPVLALNGGRSFGFDRAAAKLYTQTRSYSLAVFDRQGKVSETYPLGRADFLQLLPRPEGDRLLALTKDSLLWVEPGREPPPKDLPAGVSPPPRPTPTPTPTATTGGPDTPTDLGQAKVTGTDLAASTRKIRDAEVVTLRFRSDKTVRALHWSADGRFFYALSKDGVLQKITVPGFKEERRFEISQPCDRLEVSKEGLVVSLKGLQEIWLFDGNTLAVRKRIPMGPFNTVVSSPVLSVAFVVTGRGSSDVTVLDLARGTKAGPVSIGTLYREGKERGCRPHHEGAFECPRFRSTAVSPDGRYLFCVGQQVFGRLRIDGTSLIYEEGGPKVRLPDSHYDPQPRTEGRFVFDPQSRYVAYVDDRASRQPYSFPGLLEPGVYIFRIDDFRTPVAGLALGEPPYALSLDSVSGRVYAKSSDHQLITFDARGQRSQPRRLTRSPIETTQFLVHPTGSKFLALSRQRLLWVELPEPTERPSKEDWLAADEYRQLAESIATGAPVITGTKLRGQPQTWEHAIVVPLETKLKGGKIQGRGMQWSSDTRHFYVAWACGVLQKIRTHDQVEERRRVFGAACAGVERSKEGLVVTLSGDEKLHVLDAQTLKTLKTVAVPEVRLAVASPSSLLAAAVSGHRYDKLSLVDLAQGKVVGAHATRDFAKKFPPQKKYDDGKKLYISEFRYPYLSPDGRYLFFTNRKALCRVALRNGDLVFEEYGPPISKPLQFSPDGQHFALIAPGTRGAPKDHPVPRPYGLYIYHVASQEMPAASIAFREAPVGAVYDAKDTGFIYRDSRDRLVRTDKKGQEQARFFINPRGETIWQIMVHPDDKRVIVRGSQGAYLVQFK